jgi:hypothetical protein
MNLKHPFLLLIIFMSWGLSNPHMVYMPEMMEPQQQYSSYDRNPDKMIIEKEIIHNDTSTIRMITYGIACAIMGAIGYQYFMDSAPTDNHHHDKKHAANNQNIFDAPDLSGKASRSWQKLKGAGSNMLKSINNVLDNASYSWNHRQ